MKRKVHGLLKESNITIGKAIRVSLVFIFLFGVTSLARAQNSKLDGPFLVKKSIKVYGTCEECKSRIEKAAKSTPGVSYAHWDSDSQTLLVQYLRTKTNPGKIEERIAAQGHDTEKLKGREVADSKAGNCCH